MRGPPGPGPTIAIVLARFLVLVFVLLCAAPAVAARTNRASALDCRRSCGAAIQACVDDGGRPRKCTRNVRRLCRKNGLEVCVPPGSEPLFAVATEGFDTAGCGTTDAPCATIQYVVDTLVPTGTAATIKVARGTYDQLTSCDAGTGADRAVVCIVDKQVALIGGFIPPDWSSATTDVRETVIDAGGEGRGVVILRSEPSRPSAKLAMEGFTIRNGAARGKPDGDAFRTWAFGGGMLAGNCELTLRRMVFRQNVAVGGSTDQAAGGRGSGGGLALTGNQGTVPSASLSDVVFEENEARGGDGREVGGYALGGALFGFGYAMSGDGLRFTDNSATAGRSNGGGIEGSDKADALGGAVAGSVDSIFDLRNVHATGNVALGGTAPDGDAGGAFGGAFFAELATFALSDAVVANNEARGGDGENADGSSSIAQGGGIMATKSAVTLDRVILLRNSARSGDGAIHGGLATGGGLTITVAERDGVELPFMIRNSVVANNVVSLGAGSDTGGGGGGVWIQAGRGALEHVTIADNRLNDRHLLGAGVTILPFPGFDTRVTIDNSIFANHESPSTDPRVYTNAALWVAEGATADVTHALFANNEHHSNAGIWDVHNVPSGTITLVDVRTAPDAGFVSSGEPDDDYRLTAGSRAVDQGGASSVTIDLEGKGRPAGRAPDLGAYEVVP